jgi:hypothetical protein
MCPAPRVLLVLCLAGCASRQTVRTPAHTFLRVEHQRQEPNLCLPTSTSMILDYYGEKRDPKVLKAMATPPGSTFAGTYADDMLVALRRLGYSWRVQCFPQNAAGYAMGLPQLKRSVLDGHPVMVGLHRPPIGHVVVMVGFDEPSHELTFVDPGEDASPGLITMDEDDFRLYWRDDIVNARCATFTRPKGS